MRALLAVVHVRHGRAQLGEDEALPGEHQGAGAARRPQATVRVPTPQLEAPVRNIKITAEWGIHTCVDKFMRIVTVHVLQSSLHVTFINAPRNNGPLLFSTTDRIGD